MREQRTFLCVYQLLACALPPLLQATLDVSLSLRIPLLFLGFRLAATQASQLVPSAFMIVKAGGLEMLVPSGTPILAAVFTDVFRREAEGKSRRANEIAPVLLRNVCMLVYLLDVCDYQGLRV